LFLGGGERRRVGFGEKSSRRFENGATKNLPGPSLVEVRSRGERGKANLFDTWGSLGKRLWNGEEGETIKEVV